MNIYKQDFHIHTYYSDGQASPGEIVKAAKQLGYERIAITDHDGTDGVAEAVEEGIRVGLEVVPGIEIATKTGEGIGLHILGHGIDVNNAALRKTLKELAEKRIERNKRLIKVLNDMGYEIAMEDLHEIQPNNFIGKPVIARCLVAKGYADNVQEVFTSRSLLGSDAAQAVRKEKINSQEAVKLIKAAGGHAVLAHPIQTKSIGAIGTHEFYENIEVIICSLKEVGLEGVECLHPDQDYEQTRRFMDIAEKYGLYITRGSDFHGINFAKAEHTAEI